MNEAAGRARKRRGRSRTLAPTTSVTPIVAHPGRGPSTPPPMASALTRGPHPTSARVRHPFTGLCRDERRAARPLDQLDALPGMAQAEMPACRRRPRGGFRYQGLRRDPPYGVIRPARRSCWWWPLGPPRRRLRRPAELHDGTTSRPAPPSGSASIPWARSERRLGRAKPRHDRAADRLGAVGGPRRRISPSL